MYIRGKLAVASAAVVLFIASGNVFLSATSTPVPSSENTLHSPSGSMTVVLNPATGTVLSIFSGPWNTVLNPKTGTAESTNGESTTVVLNPATGAVLSINKRNLMTNWTNESYNGPQLSPLPFRRLD
jgi:hypothetical protein